MALARAAAIDELVAMTEARPVKLAVCTSCTCEGFVGGGDNAKKCARPTCGHHIEDHS